MPLISADQVNKLKHAAALTRVDVDQQAAKGLYNTLTKGLNAEIKKQIAGGYLSAQFDIKSWKDHVPNVETLEAAMELFTADANNNPMLNEPSWRADKEGGHANVRVILYDPDNSR